MKKQPFGTKILHYRHLAVAISFVLIIRILFSMLNHMYGDDEYQLLFENSKGAVSLDAFQMCSSLIEAQSDKHTSSEKIALHSNDTFVFSAKEKKPQSYYRLYLKEPNQPPYLLSNDKSSQHDYCPVFNQSTQQLIFRRYGKDHCSINIAELSIGLSSKYILTKERILIDCQSFSIDDLKWSHDGEYFYFTANDRKALISTDEKKNKVKSIFRYELKSNNISRISLIDKNHLSIALSSDGKWMAYVRQAKRNRWQVGLKDLVSNVDKLILNTGYHINGLSWYPNNKQLLLATSEGPIELTMNGRTRKLLIGDNTMYLWEARLTNDMKKMMVTESVSNNNLWRYPNPLIEHSIKPEEKGKGEQLSFSNKSDYLPKYSNKGSKIAYVSDRSSKTEIMLIDEDGSTKQLTQSTGYDFSLTQLQWSPTDDALLFSANNAVFLLDIKSNVIKRVTKKRDEIDHPTWSKDGESIYFSAMTNGTLQIWRKNLTTKKLTQVTYFGGLHGYESYDSKTLYYIHPNKKGLWSMSLINGEDLAPAEQLVIPDFIESSLTSWQVFGNGIYYIGTEENQSTLKFWNFQNEKARPIQMERGTTLVHFSVSPDQQSIIKLNGSNQMRIATLESVLN